MLSKARALNRHIKDHYYNFQDYTIYPPALFVMAFICGLGWTAGAWVFSWFVSY